jgi:thiamine-phosphate diphosphorylase
MAGQAGQGDESAVLLQQLILVAEAGVEMVQIRERDLESGALARLVERCVAALRGLPTRILVNDRLDVAIAAGAHGVHLRTESIPPSRARAIVPRGFLIGRSVHSAEEARRVDEAGGVDYLVLGTVFPTRSKPGVETIVGPAELALAVRAVRVPVLAIGGITEDRLEVVARTGAAGFAAIGLFAQVESAATFIARTRNIVESARRWFDSGEGVPRQ